MASDGFARFKIFRFLLTTRYVAMVSASFLSAIMTPHWKVMPISSSWRVLCDGITISQTQ